jgi:O-antigen ligase
MFLNNPKSIFIKFVEYALYVFFILFPFVNYSLYLYSGTTTRAVNTTLLVTIFSIILGFWLFDSKNKISLPKSPIVIALCIYFVSMIMSGIYGFNFHTSFWSNVTRMTGIWYVANLAFLLMFISVIISDKAKQRKLILSIVLSTAFYSILYFFSYEGLGLIFKDYKNYAFTFGNSTFAAMYIFGAFILSIYYLYSSDKRKWWMYVLPVLLIINPSIINRNLFLGNWSGGVTSFIGEARASSIVVLLSIISIFFAWIISKIKYIKIRNNTIVSIFVLVILGICFAGYSLLTPEGYIRKIYLAEASSARPLLWEVSTKVIDDSPVLGWGVDNFERVIEKYYDNRQLQEEYGNEAWFDRAHNIFVDQTLDGGYIGLSTYLSIYLVLGLSLLYVILKSKIKEDAILATLLLIYFGLHLLELQTAFDTSVSYMIIVVMLALAVNLFHKTIKEKKGVNVDYDLNKYLKYTFASLTIIFFTYTLFVGLVPFMRTQWANGYMRTIGSSEKRLEKYDILFSSKIDISVFLWRTMIDLQRGIGQNPSILNDSKKVESLNKEAEYLAKKYKEYLIDNPRDYRSHLNLANILIYMNLFSNNRLDEAQVVLDEAIKLVPNNPQAYWMKAVAYIYQAKFSLASEWAQKGLAVNPKIKESQNIVKYVEDSIKTFPEIDLYFFKQT